MLSGGKKAAKRIQRQRAFEELWPHATQFTISHPKEFNLFIRSHHIATHTTFVARYPVLHHGVQGFGNAIGLAQ